MDARGFGDPCQAAVLARVAGGSCSMTLADSCPPRRRLRIEGSSTTWSYQDWR
jgi:hypothetical protein